MLHGSIRLEQAKHKASELRHEILFLRQAIQAEKVERALDCGIDAKIRELEARGAIYRQLIAGQAGSSLAGDIAPRLEDPPESTAARVRADAEWYYQDYAKRLGVARAIVAEKERRGHRVPGRRALVRDWLSLYRESGYSGSLNEICKAVRAYERGEL